MKKLEEMKIKYLAKLEVLNEMIEQGNYPELNYTMKEKAGLCLEVCNDLIILENELKNKSDE